MSRPHPTAPHLCGSCFYDKRDCVCAPASGEPRMSDERSQKFRALMLTACEELGRHGLASTPDAIASLASLVANASYLGAEVDAAKEIASLRSDAALGAALLAVLAETPEGETLEIFRGSHRPPFAQPFDVGTTEGDGATSKMSDATRRLSALLAERREGR